MNKNHFFFEEKALFSDTIASELFSFKHVLFYIKETGKLYLILVTVLNKLAAQSVVKKIKIDWPCSLFLI